MAGGAASSLVRSISKDPAFVAAAIAVLDGYRLSLTITMPPPSDVVRELERLDAVVSKLSSQARSYLVAASQAISRDPVLPEQITSQAVIRAKRAYGRRHTLRDSMKIDAIVLFGTHGIPPEEALLTTWFEAVAAEHQMALDPRRAARDTLKHADWLKSLHR